MKKFIFLFLIVYNLLIFDSAISHPSNKGKENFEQIKKSKIEHLTNKKICVESAKDLQEIRKCWKRKKKLS